MLEIAKILRDIDNLGRIRAETYSGIGDELTRADEIVALIGQDVDAARKRISDAHTSWLVAGFDEAPDRVYERQDIPAKHAVIATDGSQIMPDKHEVTLCYLLNAASIILYYGTGERPFSRTVPKLCYKDEDLCVQPYGGRRVPVNEKLVGTARTLAEAREMESAIRAAKASGLPSVALWDGSLILWSLQNEPPDFREQVLSQYLHTFDIAEELGIPIAGYVSDPGSKDFVNSMRVMLCDQSPIDCDLCKHRERNEILPCDAIARLKDSTVLTDRLKGGNRSILFDSSSSILEKYGRHKVQAFYMDVGRETVRIEVPLWVAQDETYLNLVHGVCSDQAVKGRGYPIALSEAHEHAVVRGPERRAFYEMVERSFMKHGVRLNYSLKRISKGY
jgi:hypothetical protein